MAADPKQLNLDTTVWPQYYFCTIRNIPLPMQAPQLVEFIVPQESSEAVRGLSALGRQIVLHQLYTYKEPLETKFGYFTFFLKTSEESDKSEDAKAKAHALVRQWITSELPLRLTEVKMVIALGQPPECYHSEPFLQAYREQCSLAKKEVSPDPRKIETFVVSRLKFNEAGANARANPVWATEGEPFQSSSAAPPSSHTWSPVGTFATSTLTPLEVMWLKKNTVGFPAVSITNGDVKTAHVEGDLLERFFQKHLSPLITVSK